MTFRAAVQEAAELAAHFRPGLQALTSAHAGRVVCAHPRKLTGSINIDAALQPAFPNAPRWDYGIGYVERHAEVAIWVEVHSANSTHVSEVIDKVKWLRKWLSDHAPALFKMTRRSDGFVWVATGPVALQRGSRQARQLAQAGVSFPRRNLKL